MSLAPRERQALARIEEALRSSDPVLAAELTTFTRRAWHRRIPWRRGQPFVPRSVKLAMSIVITLAGVALFIMMMTLSSRAAHHGSPVSCQGAVSQIASCRSGQIR